MPKIMSRTLAPLYPLLCLCALSTPAMAEPGREPPPASAIPRVLMGTPPVNVNTSAAGTLPKNLFFSALNVSFADKTHAEKGGAARSDVFGQTWLLKLRYGLTDHVEFVARTLHEHHFAHNDLKWRNLLVDTRDTLYLIDCPGGQRWPQPFLRYRIIKDLACLDKLGKHHLSRTWRMRFFHAYTGCARLSTRDKALIRRILQFFAGRE
ncbi:hypothetical protein FACS189488_12150 [Betaproteobacteria bacterium]|nr:hypothetical protein FACS189488_12150 [Betaproteobacteria bacterium]